MEAREALAARGRDLEEELAALKDAAFAAAMASKQGSPTRWAGRARGGGDAAASLETLELGPLTKQRALFAGKTSAAAAATAVVLCQQQASAAGPYSGGGGAAAAAARKAGSLIGVEDSDVASSHVSAAGRAVRAASLPLRSRA